MATDPYVYPGTNVLKNLAGIKEYDRLRQFEAVLTAYRISELLLKPIPGPLDSAYLQKLHRFIFQDVYSWAGEFRSVDIRKEGEFWFCRYQFIQESLSRLFNQLTGENMLTHTTPQEFGRRAGYYLNELNAIHPFREGNGRVQREFIFKLGLNAGLNVDWSQVSQEEMNAASAIGFQTARSQYFAGSDCENHQSRRLAIKCRSQRTGRFPGFRLHYAT